MTKSVNFSSPLISKPVPHLLTTSKNVFVLSYFPIFDLWLCLILVYFIEKLLSVTGTQTWGGSSANCSTLDHSTIQPTLVNQWMFTMIFCKPKIGSSHSKIIKKDDPFYHIILFSVQANLSEIGDLMLAVNLFKTLREAHNEAKWELGKAEHYRASKRK